MREERPPRYRCDHVCAADHRPAERMPAEDGLCDLVVDEILRVVVHHRDLLEHDLPLRVELGEGRGVDHPGTITSSARSSRSSGTRANNSVVSREVAAFSSPPSSSKISAISCAVCVFEPLKSRCSMKCDTPARASVSSREPAPIQKPSDTERTLFDAFGDQPLAGRERRELVPLHRWIVALAAQLSRRSSTARFRRPWSRRRSPNTTKTRFWCTRRFGAEPAPMRRKLLTNVSLDPHAEVELLGGDADSAVDRSGRQARPLTP